MFKKVNGVKHLGKEGVLRNKNPGLGTLEKDKRFRLGEIHSVELSPTPSLNYRNCVSTF